MSRFNPNTGSFLLDEDLVDHRKERREKTINTFKQISENFMNNELENGYIPPYDDSDDTEILELGDIELVEAPIDSIESLEEFEIAVAQSNLSSKIVDIKRKYENSRKEKLAKIARKEKYDIEHAKLEIMTKIKNERENMVIEQFIPVFDNSMTEFGMAVATLLRLGLYNDKDDLMRSEIRKAGVYIRDQVMSTIIDSARDALRDELFNKAVRNNKDLHIIVKDSVQNAPSLTDTSVHDSFNVV